MFSFPWFLIGVFTALLLLAVGLWLRERLEVGALKRWEDDMRRWRSGGR
jgi:hypothetical protein